MKQTNLRTFTIAALLLAVGQVLPFLTGQIPQIGSMLSPMHIPVLLCGFLCGPQYGALIGFICPLLRSVLFGMPKIFPTALAMAFELCTYGFVTGFLFYKAKTKNMKTVYISLIAAMLIGRIVWGIVNYCLLTIQGSAFPMEAFLAGAFLNAWPGIILHLILIPLIIQILNKSGIIQLD